MSLDKLVDEIRARVSAEVDRTQAEADAEVQRIEAEAQRQLDGLREGSARRTEREIEQERAQKLASARLQARKLIYEAREREMEKALGETRHLLEQYTRSKEYVQVLKHMYQAATSELGSPIRVFGRKEDQAVLETVAGKSAAKTALPILGGLVAETPDGARRLDLSFEELMRLREDKVRAILAS
jgi:V/A-type H+-transporting ATPase subunit E